MDKSEQQGIGHRSGYVAIVGRPNTGKSTLLNALVGQKISITSRKPQTTRQHLLGISTKPGAQILYLDTPGLQASPGDAVNRYMNREAVNALMDVEIVILVIEASRWNDLDELVLSHLEKIDDDRIFLVINKVDRIADKAELIPFIETVGAKRNFAEIFPMSARAGHDVERLEKLIIEHLPEAEAEYPDDQITNRNSRFIAAEFIREKLIDHLGDEIPYKLAVTIDKFTEGNNRIDIHATIWVEKEGQKKIIIGKGGSMLKRVGQLARLDMQRLFDCKVNLKTWVKVRQKWTDDEAALRRFNFE